MPTAASPVAWDARQRRILASIAAALHGVPWVPPPDPVTTEPSPDAATVAKRKEPTRLE